MIVPSVGGPEIVKFECPGKSNFMIVPSVGGPEIVKLELWKIKKKDKLYFFNSPRFQLYDFTPPYPQ